MKQYLELVKFILENGEEKKIVQERGLFPSLVTSLNMI